MSILNDIIVWVADKPKFWTIAIDRLIRNNNLTNSDISELKNVCKWELGLLNNVNEDIDFDNLKNHASLSSRCDSIILSKILNIENINALSNDSILQFASTGLTVVYGDNGSGKSSYVSILKHICNTRGQKPAIHDNLFDPTSRGKDKKAEVEYTIDGINFHSIKLNNTEISDSALKNVDVFDSFSANHYIDGEDEIAFIPHGLSILEKFALSLNQIEAELNKEIQTLRLSKFDYSVLHVEEGTQAKIFLENLNDKTTLEEFRTYSQWDKTKDHRIIALNDAIVKLKALDPRKTLKINEEKINRFNILKNRFQLIEKVLLGDYLIKIKSILNNFIITRDTLKVTSEKIFSDLPITGVGNDSWRKLWESARKFYNESKNQELFPETNEGSNCPLCLQELGNVAKQRFSDFEDFIKQDVQQEYDRALNVYNDLIKKLKEISFDFNELEPTISEIEDSIKGYKECQESYLKALLSQKDYIINQLTIKKTIEVLTQIEFEKNAKTIIENLIRNLEKENEKLKTQSIDVELKSIEAELDELKGGKLIYEFRTKLAREIFRQKKVVLLNQCLSKCNTRSITTLSNQLVTTYISPSLRQNFQEELDKVGFRNIKIETETKGVRGKQYHFLRLDEPNAKNIALKEILSEGEHRCIALSTFLSELSLSDHKSTIIFDDPVSSLDHKWRYSIAKRIVEESKNRQVIVFTHDITFLLMIQEHSEKSNCKLEIKSLTRKKTETGIIASNPPWDALPVNKRLGILKNDYQKLEKIERTETDEVYCEAVKPLYGKLRETWERFIEEVFLNGTIQRFGRDIQTQRLAKITDLTDEDYKLVDENMGKCSTYFLGHDSAGELINQLPDSNDFLADITILEDYTAVIRKRRK